MDETMGSKTLKTASEAGDIEMVKRHVEGGADVNGRTSKGHFPLGGAVINGHFAVVEYLLEAGAKVNAKSEYGWTPLYLAARQGHARIAKLLIAAGANLNSRTRMGYFSPDRWTPLHVAVYNGHIEVVRELARAGCQLEHKDGDGLTPLAAANKSGNLGIAQYLRRRLRRIHKAKQDKSLSK